MATIEERLKEVKEQLKKIESELKGVEQKPVAGWRKHKESSKHLAYFDGECFVYGFDMLGEWFDYRGIKFDFVEGIDYSSGIFYSSDPADPKEVEQRLIEEAKRRGFKEGVKFNCLFSGLPRKVNKLIYRIDHFNSDRVLCSDIGLIFNKGKWAEIIEEPLTLNGKEVVVHGDHIEWNDDYYRVKDIEGLCEMVNVESVNFYDEKVSIKDLKQLLTKIEERENR